MDIPPHRLIYASVPLTCGAASVVHCTAQLHISKRLSHSFHYNFVPHLIVGGHRSRKHERITKRQFQEFTYKLVSMANHLNSNFFHRRQQHLAIRVSHKKKEKKKEAN